MLGRSNTSIQYATSRQGEKYRREGIVIRAPNSDLARDPRWGRSEESYGEDPYLSATMAVAFIKGLQGNDPKYWLTAFLMKHFLANSNENGRDGSSYNFDERLLREYYSVPFCMGVTKGDARDEKVTWQLQPDGLHLQLPQEPLGQYAYTLRMPMEAK